MVSKLFASCCLFTFGSNGWLASVRAEEIPVSPEMPPPIKILPPLAPLPPADDSDKFLKAVGNDAIKHFTDFLDAFQNAVHEAIDEFAKRIAKHSDSAIFEKDVKDLLAKIGVSELLTLPQNGKEDLEYLLLTPGENTLFEEIRSDNFNSSIRKFFEDLLRTLREIKVKFYKMINPASGQVNHKVEKISAILDKFIDMIAGNRELLLKESEDAQTETGFVAAG